MPHTARSATDTPPLQVALSTAQLGITMSRVLAMPLAALRASMESLLADFGGQDERGRAIEGALEEVLRLSRSVQALVDWAAPPRVRPLRCNAEELLEAALRPLSAESRRRLSISRPARNVALSIDGPLFSAALQHLLENLLAHNEDSALLRVSAGAEDVTFTLVGAAPFGAGIEGFTARRSSARAAQVELGIGLARREIERMGGRVEAVRTDLGTTCVRIDVPLGIPEPPGEDRR